MKRKMLTGLLLLVLLLNISYVITGCGVNSSESFPHPTIAQSGALAEMELNFPNTLSARVSNDTVQAYELAVDLEAIPFEVESALGLDLSIATEKTFENYTYYDNDEFTVMIDAETGYWTYKLKNAPSLLYDEMISDDEAIQIATQFVAENDLWTGEFSNIAVTNTTGGGWTHEEYVKEKNIYFYPSIDGRSVLGIFRICVSLDPYGTIVDVKKQVNEVSVATQLPAKSLDSLQSDLNLHHYSGSFSESLDNAEISDCNLSYYADAISVEGKTYLYPVYVLLGEGETSSGEIETFDIIIDAQK